MPTSAARTPAATPASANGSTKRPMLTGSTGGGDALDVLQLTPIDDAALDGVIK